MKMSPKGDKWAVSTGSSKPMIAETNLKGNIIMTSSSATASSSSLSASSSNIQAKKNAGYIASVVSLYWFVSISMVYLNKILMSSENVSIDAPLFVTWFQCVVTCLICMIAGKLGERHNAKYNRLPMQLSGSMTSSGGSSSSMERKSFFAQFPEATYNSSVGMKVFPLSIVFVGMITFNNLTLKWVEVSFYNVARSLTIVFNVFFSYIMLNIGTSARTSMCLLVVIFGFFIGSAGEVNFSFNGTIAGVLSSLFVSLNSIYTKKVLPVVDDNHWKLTFYNNCNAVVLFTPLIIFFEMPVLADAIDNQLTSGLFWFAMLVAGFFGFSIGIVTVLQIKATSPLTHNISGTAKAAVQSAMAFYIWKNQPTFKGVLGILFVLGGSLMYTLVKMNENKPVKHTGGSTEMKATK